MVFLTWCRLHGWGPPCSLLHPLCRASQTWHTVGALYPLVAHTGSWNIPLLEFYILCPNSKCIHLHCISLILKADLEQGGSMGIRDHLQQMRSWVNVVTLYLDQNSSSYIWSLIQWSSKFHRGHKCQYLAWQRGVGIHLRSLSRLELPHCAPWSAHHWEHGLAKLHRGPCGAACCQLGWPWEIDHFIIALCLLLWVTIHLLFLMSFHLLFSKPPGTPHQVAPAKAHSPLLTTGLHTFFFSHLPYFYYTGFDLPIISVKVSPSAT